MHYRLANALVAQHSLPSKPTKPAGAISLAWRRSTPRHSAPTLQGGGQRSARHATHRRSLAGMEFHATHDLLATMLEAGTLQCAAQLAALT